MKKNILIFILLHIGITIFAQSYVELGGGLSNLTGSYPGTGARMSYSIGGGYRFNYRSGMGLDTGLQLALSGAKDYGILEIRMPVIVSYQVSSFDFGVGPYIAVGLWDQKNDSRFYDAPGTKIDPLAESAFGYVNRFDAGVDARLRYHLSRFFFGWEGYFGLVDRARNDLSASFHSHSIGMHLFVGYSF